MAKGVNLTFHGAARTATGSCTEIVSEGRHTRLDCSLFQGSRSLETLNYGAIPSRRTPLTQLSSPVHISTPAPAAPTVAATRALPAAREMVCIPDHAPGC
ncbi:hypothetical protein SAMN05444580_104146 [Rhodococcus tukisamuensis]|uniref:Uncharacterized protein n=1 Tax=Rhodococcus tukisamuensis TaxID=168276 RepID=A0A1G6UCP6_9NOCA|nr:hypothetical protein SAMN05444580_104146 [Rhodococcus tukisamuensis]